MSRFNKILLCVVAVVLAVVLISSLASSEVKITLKGTLAFIILAVFIVLGGLIEYIWFSKMREKNVVRAIPVILLAVAAGVSGLYSRGSYAILTMYVLELLGFFGSIIVFLAMKAREKVKAKKNEEDEWQ